MNAVIKAAIEALSEKAKSADTSHEAMQFAQAALNLAHTGATIEGIQRENEKA